MRRIAVRDFTDNPTKYLVGNEPVAIERFGEPIGYYFPVAVERHDPVAEAERSAKVAESLVRFEKLMQEILDRTGMTEDEFARYFDLNEPFPEEPVEPRATPVEAEHAASG
jgi:hypothetical protein